MEGGNAATTHQHKAETFAKSSTATVSLLRPKL